MPIIEANSIDQYYEIDGEGSPLILIHGGFVDLHIWDSQIEYFSDRYQIIRYDLRGHGKTGPSKITEYSVELFTDDLKALLDALGVEQAIICGISFGGMVAQAFAVKYKPIVHALVLSDTAVSVSLTLADKFQRYVLFPKWMMRLTIRLLGVEKFVDYSFWLAKATRSEEWFGKDKATREYVQERMLEIEENEYVKIYDAIYDFHLLELQVIDAPTLVLNGEYESKSVFRHSEEILKLVMGSEMKIVPEAGHTSNMENPDGFNILLQQFLDRSA